MTGVDKRGFKKEDSGVEEFLIRLEGSTYAEPEHLLGIFSLRQPSSRAWKPLPWRAVIDALSTLPELAPASNAWRLSNAGS